MHGSQIEVLPDATVLSEHGLLTRCDIGAKTVKRSGMEYFILQLFVLANII
jgi:hypothetical protein